jgi:hypothetical protein
MSLRFFSLLVLVFLAAPRAWADLELKPQERENLGIQTEQATSVETGRQWSATAQVLDATPLVTSLGEIEAADVAAQASKSEAERNERLYREQTNVARKTLEAARTQAATDSARLSTARAQLVGSWGQGIAALSATARAALVGDLVAGRISLARVDLVQSLPVSLNEPQVEVRGLDGGNSLAARWLGRLPQGSSATLGGSGLLRVAAPLAAGSLLEAVLSEPTASIKGVSVPASAVIRWRGGEWVYEETAANHFVRREVKSGLRVGTRRLLAAPGKTDLKIVTVGARALLGAELGAADSGESEQGN